jgi:iron(II)-dependent oxidoreductase
VTREAAKQAESPANARPPEALRVQATCPDGKDRTVDTEGHCCWPGQRWSAEQEKCAGPPDRCLEGYEVGDNTCRKTACPTGKERTADAAGQCCWPGQAWLRSEQRCVGKPDHCPDKMTAQGEGCVTRGRAGIAWISLPGGSFWMGSSQGDGDEQPPHRVTLSAFDIARSETTVAQYAACVTARACSAPAKSEVVEACNWGVSGRSDHPINCVDWGQARAFCAWAGGRLPTEAEWEYAARSGGREIEYPWGDEEPSCARAVMTDGEYGCGMRRTWAVCSMFRGNTAQDVCDMAGNALERVADWYDDEYYRKSAAVDPAGPSDGSERVLRGGGWSGTDASCLRSRYRDKVAPDVRFEFLGFRCARSPAGR